MADVLNNQEKLFFARVAEHMASGLDMESACRAVLADDQRIWDTFHKLNSYDRDGVVRVLSRQVFGSIHMREALA